MPPRRLIAPEAMAARPAAVLPVAITVRAPTAIIRTE